MQTSVISRKQLPKIEEHRLKGNEMSNLFAARWALNNTFHGNCVLYAYSTSNSKILINLFFRYRQSRFNARRIRKRVVFKHGDCNVEVANVAKRRRKYLQDIFTTLVDAQWRWTLLVFAMNFLLSWLLFAVVWWLIVFSHGDLSPERVSVNNSFFYLINYSFG